MLDGKHGSAFAVFLASNFSLTMLAAVLTVFVAPAAAGSGIPEVKAYLNGVDAPNIFSLKTLMVKVVGCIAATCWINVKPSVRDRPGVQAGSTYQSEQRRQGAAR